jgi:hypothetical protein
VNSVDAPIKYEVESIDVIIGDKAISKPMFDNRGGVIARGRQQTFLYPRFEIPKPRGKDLHTDGVIRFVIQYGHPEVGFSRRMQRELNCGFRLGGKSGVAYTVLRESDVPIQH